MVPSDFFYCLPVPWQYGHANWPFQPVPLQKEHFHCAYAPPVMATMASVVMMIFFILCVFVEVDSRFFSALSQTPVAACRERGG